jgi:hypothetical protein
LYLKPKYHNACRFARVGSVVLAIHDASDVILEFAKLSKYLGSEVGASVAFLLFVLSWIVLRLIYFPAFVIWSTRYSTEKLFKKYVSCICTLQILYSFLKYCIQNILRSCPDSTVVLGCVAMKFCSFWTERRTRRALSCTISSTPY